MTAPTIQKTPARCGLLNLSLVAHHAWRANNLISNLVHIQCLARHVQSSIRKPNTQSQLSVPT